MGDEHYPNEHGRPYAEHRDHDGDHDHGHEQRHSKPGWR
jgi:hypothetical protein